MILSLQFKKIFRRGLNALTLAAALVACAPATPRPFIIPDQPTPTPTQLPPVAPYPTRPPYNPGELVDYIAQPGDTLPALAVHFNTRVNEIRAANPVIPQDATTMPPGFPMKIPIYYLPFWGNPYQIIPDSLFVNGPAQVGFDTSAFIAQQKGWLNGYMDYASNEKLSSAEIIDLVATNFSVSPRLLLALLEYQAGALSNPLKPDTDYLLGEKNYEHKGFYLQLVWAANTLNNGYYGWRGGLLTDIELSNGRSERFDPWQNAASVALHYYFSRNFAESAYARAVSDSGLARTYAALFGAPWPDAQPHIPASLQQPAFLFPFPQGDTWTYTGGPHTGWGKGQPFAAVDFAPAGVSECNATSSFATAVADGVVARVETGVVVLDLDILTGTSSDGDERTGWDIFYLHLAGEGRAPLGAILKAGDAVGHPSCEGGETTGTHLHIARKFNGEWILADGPLAFNFEGWLAHSDGIAYQGTMTRYSEVVTASDKSESKSQVTAGK